MSSHWGSYVWVFLHTLFERIDDSFYIQEKENLIQIVVSLCYSLPCNDCKSHAIKYIQKHLNKNNLLHKHQMQNFLFTFHDSVNKRINKPTFTQFQVYKTLSFSVVFQEFVDHYVQRKYNSFQFIDKQYRNDVNSRIIKFVLKNKNHFQ